MTDSHLTVVDSPTPKAESITGAMIFAAEPQMVSMSFTIDETVHHIGVQRNELDTGWDVRCSCGEFSIGMVDGRYADGRVITFRDKETCFRDSCAEAWNHISGEVVYSITGD